MQNEGLRFALFRSNRWNWTHFLSKKTETIPELHLKNRKRGGRLCLVFCLLALMLLSAVPVVLAATTPPAAPLVFAPTCSTSKDIPTNATVNKVYPNYAKVHIEYSGPLQNFTVTFFYKPFD